MRPETGLVVGELWPEIRRVSAGAMQAGGDIRLVPARPPASTASIRAAEIELQHAAELPTNNNTHYTDHIISHNNTTSTNRRSHTNMTRLRQRQATRPCSS